MFQIFSPLIVNSSVDLSPFIQVEENSGKLSYVAHFHTLEGSKHRSVLILNSMFFPYYPAVSSKTF